MDNKVAPTADVIELVRELQKRQKSNTDLQWPTAEGAWYNDAARNFPLIAEALIIAVDALEMVVALKGSNDIAQDDAEDMEDVAKDALMRIHSPHTP